MKSILVFCEVCPLWGKTVTPLARTAFGMSSEAYERHLETEEHKAYASGLAPLHDSHQGLVEAAGVPITRIALPCDDMSLKLTLWVPRDVVELLRVMGPARIDNRSQRVAAVCAAMTERLGPAIRAAISAGYPKVALEIATAELSTEELDAKVKWFTTRQREIK